MTLVLDDIVSCIHLKNNILKNFKTEFFISNPNNADLRLK